MEGAALASFISIFLFNVAKLAFVKRKFGFSPFTNATYKVFGTLALLWAVFQLLQFPFNRPSGLDEISLYPLGLQRKAKALLRQLTRRATRH